MTIKRGRKALSNGRPPSSKPKERMTSGRSRTIIRTYHRLQKAQALALRLGNTETADRLKSAIEKNGGIKAYQAASKQGQARDRGGDSSKVLVQWLQKHKLKDTKVPACPKASTRSLSCLEIGALSTRNEISRFPGTIRMTRIDLNSQEKGIAKQDFMDRPLPTNEDEYFDIISLSLVLNYVPDPTSRGRMLGRLTKFLRLVPEDANQRPPLLPALFLVLPLPCVENSRYMNLELLLHIMTNLGFLLLHKKRSPKLAYYIFHWTGQVSDVKCSKKKVDDGPRLNNFSIVVD